MVGPISRCLSVGKDSRGCPANVYGKWVFAGGPMGLRVNALLVLLTVEDFIVSGI